MLTPRCNFTSFVQRVFPSAPKVFRASIANAGEQVHHALECDLVARIRHESNKSRDIFDVGLLEKANATRDLIGNTTTRKLKLELDCVIMRPVDHGDDV